LLDIETDTSDESDRVLYTQMEYDMMESDNDSDMSEDTLIQPPELSNLVIDDHVLVKFQKKKNNKLFVDRVMNVGHNNNEIQSKFMRRIPTKNSNLTFYFSDAEDICIHEVSDVILTSPVPIPSVALQDSKTF